ncbi:MAG: hypothetical protein Q8R24_09480 [Legionellaceae bacterium]|nr:hypothetical protein [Legionellaceae bacterium]
MFSKYQGDPNNPKFYRSILNDRYLLTEDYASLIIIGTAEDRAIFVETYVNSIATITATKFTDIKKTWILTLFPLLPDDRADKWKKINFPDIASAKADFDKMERQKTICHTRKCSLDQMEAFLSALSRYDDGYVMVSQIDLHIRGAYKEIFGGELIYTESSTCVLS